MIHALSRPFPSRYGAPVLDRVDSLIFTARYFVRCMECSSCGDWCCSHGVDVDAPNAARIMGHADALEPLVGRPRAEWLTDVEKPDAEMPGGAYRRTRAIDGACVFLDRTERGCKLHRYALSIGLDYHELKPMVSALFPVTFDEGLLHPSDEVHDGTLVCMGETYPSLYEGARDELAFYFGGALVAELDALARRIAPEDVRVRLPVVDRSF